MICLISNAIQIRIEGAWTWNSNDDGAVIASQTIEPSGMREMTRTCAPGSHVSNLG